jgi:endoglucanase
MFAVLLYFSLSGIVSTLGQLSVKGTNVVGSNGTPVILRGVSFGWHNWWSDFFNPTAVDQLVDTWKATVIRAAIGIDVDGAFNENPDLAYRCAYAVIDEAIKKDVYVIVDFHCHHIQLQSAISFFKTIATKYGGKKNRIYELFNEPDGPTWTQVKEYSIELIKLIRGLDPDALILVGCPEWDQQIGQPATDPITGYSNIAYTLHFYAGTHTSWLRTRADEAIQKGIAIFVSECGGMNSDGDGPIATTEWNNWINWMETNKISYAAYSISNVDATLEWKEDTGLHLNGISIRIHGVCLHHDLGLFGSALNPRALERQLEIMKEMGVNGIRTFHNPPSPELLDFCDQMGLLVMDEAFHQWEPHRTKLIIQITLMNGEILI